LDENKLLLVQRGKPAGATKVVMRSGAYALLMEAASANLPSETVGALLGAVSQPQRGQQRIVVRDVAAIGLAPAGGLGLTVDLAAWENLKKSLDDSGDEGMRLVGWFYADPGSGIFRPRLLFSDVQQALAADARLFLFVNPSTDQGAFYIAQSNGLAPLGGFFEAADANSEPVIPWNGEIRGGLEWLGVTPVALTSPATQAKAPSQNVAPSPGRPTQVLPDAGVLPQTDTGANNAFVIEPAPSPQGRSGRDVPQVQVAVRAGAGSTALAPYSSHNGSPYMSQQSASPGRRIGRSTLMVFLLWQLLGLLLCGLGVGALQQGQTLFGPQIPATKQQLPAPTATPVGLAPGPSRQFVGLSAITIGKPATGLLYLAEPFPSSLGIWYSVLGSAFAGPRRDASPKGHSPP